MRRNIKPFTAEVQIGAGCLNESGLAKELFLAQVKVHHPIYTCVPVDYDECSGYLTIEFRPPILN
jgi:hypothetical protein